MILNQVCLSNMDLICKAANGQFALNYYNTLQHDVNLTWIFPTSPLKSTWIKDAQKMRRRHIRSEECAAMLSLSPAKMASRRRRV
jgi:hypothetical protein